GAVLTQEEAAARQRAAGGGQQQRPQPQQAADDDLPQGPVPVEVPDDMDVEDGAPGKRYVAAVKAELIDVGIPRHDTVEAGEQWPQLGDKSLTTRDGVPYPGPLYYVLEYLMMVEEAVSGDARTQQKSVKRIKRFLQILSVQSGAMTAAIQRERDLIP